MLNFKLIGFDEKLRKVSCAAIRLGMTMLGFKPDDVVITSMSHDHPKPIGELIRLYGFSDSAMGLAYFPKEIDREAISSHVETLGGELAPYVEVYASTLERTKEIVEYMKPRHLGCNVEQWIIPPAVSIPGEFEYPCVKVVVSKESEDSLSDVLSRLRELGVRRIHTRILDGFNSAKQMR